MSIIGSVGVRIVPDMTSLGATVGAAVAGSGSVLTRAGASMAALITAPIVAGIAVSVGAAASWESAFAEVRKSVDAPVAVLNQLEQAARDMAKEMPFAREEIAQTMAAIGRFTNDPSLIENLTETALMLGTTTGMNGASLAESLARIMEVTQTPLSSADELGSSITALGNEMPTTEANIISMATRLSQISAVANVSAQDILGISAAMSSVGIRAEMGGSAMARVFYTIDDVIKTGGDDLADFTKQFGLSADEFVAKWSKDPAAALGDFLQGVKDLSDSGANVPPILKEWGLGEIRVRDTLLRTSQAVDQYRYALGLSNEAFDENTAMQQEYMKRADTFNAKWQIFKNRASDVAVTLGKALLPVFLDILIALDPFIELIGNLATAFGQMDPNMRKTIIWFALLLATIGPMMVIGTKVFQMIQNLGLAFNILRTAVMGHPILILLAAIALAAWLIYDNWDTVGPYIMAALEGIKDGFVDLWHVIVDVWNDVWAKTQEIWGYIWNFLVEWWPLLLGALMGPIGLLAGLIYKYWDEIWMYTQVVWGFITSVISAAVGAIVGFFVTIYQWVISHVVSAFLQARDVASTVWGAVAGFVEGAANRIVAAVGRVKSAVGDALGPLGDFLGKAASIGGGAIGAVLNAAIPGRAVGGPTLASHPYWVGERGPELFVPRSAGSVVPTHELGNGGGITIQGPLLSIDGPITIRDDRDLEELAELLQERTNEQLAAAGRRVVGNQRGSF